MNWQPPTGGDADATNDEAWLRDREANASRTVACRSCGAAIIWLSTKAGKTMPTDASRVKPHDTLFDYEQHTSHFATCPNAAAHRRSR